MKTSTMLSLEMPPPSTSIGPKSRSRRSVESQEAESVEALDTSTSNTEAAATILPVASPQAETDRDSGAIDDEQNRTEQLEQSAERAQAASTTNAGIEQIATDFPRPPALDSRDEFIFYEEVPAADNYQALGKLLAGSGDIYRRPGYRGGLFLASPDFNVPPTVVDKGSHLVAIAVDRLRVTHVLRGKIIDRRIPIRHANTMLKSEIFLRQFRPIDELIRTARYMQDFRLTVPGYNDGGRGQRFLHVGPPARIEAGIDAIKAFLGVMAFDTDADETNAVGAALRHCNKITWSTWKWNGAFHFGRTV